MFVKPEIELLFKTESKNSGLKLYSENKVRLLTRSNLSFEFITQTSNKTKTHIKTTSIASAFLSLSCNCTNAKKKRFCKHIWASLLYINNLDSDFLENKTTLTLDVNSNSDSSVELKKQRARIFRKDQYQKQKTLQKSKSLKKAKSSLKTNSYSLEVNMALQYFELNGFPMQDGPSKDIMLDAKKKLSRFFHPDRGGSHEEFVELNQHCETIQSYLSNR